METKSWKVIKDNVYGVKGADRRDELERDFEKIVGFSYEKKRCSFVLATLFLLTFVLKRPFY